MGRSSKHVRLQGRKIFLALLAAALVLMAVSAPVNAVKLDRGVKIAIRMVNNSKTRISAAYCPLGHVSIQYKFGTRHDPCNQVTYTHRLNGGGDRYTYTANPVGIVVTGNHKTLYFYARNPAIGKPFFEINGQKVSMVEGELATRHAVGATVRFHREGDRDGHKQMTIEIISMG